MCGTENVKEQFKRVIEFSQDMDTNAQVDQLFARWMEAKAKFVKRFGGLIYEWPEPVEFTLDPVEKQKKVRQLVSCIADSYHNNELANFIDANADTFFDNVISDTSVKEEIPKGMKLIKAFKYFEKDKAILSHMQDLASQYIQENKIKGILCFSVHPLDFLSSSENTYNWRSCHALDGEYRGGNLSYMVDETTFMVYLKGEKGNVRLPRFPHDVPWNDKKWRMLIHAAKDDSLMFASRQYPFASKPGIDMVLNVYNNLLVKEGNPQHPWRGPNRYNNWSQYYIDRYTRHDNHFDEVEKLGTRYLIINSFLADINQVMTEGSGALNYNDVLCSTCYDFPYYAISSEWWGHISKLVSNPIVVGGAVKCVQCGCDYVHNPETMKCDDCHCDDCDYDDNYVYCSCCDSRTWYEDIYYVGNSEEPVCEYCFADECFICDNCGLSYFNEDKSVVSNEDGAEFLCKHCYEKRFEKR